MSTSAKESFSLTTLISHYISNFTSRHTTTHKSTNASRQLQLVINQTQSTLLHNFTERWRHSLVQSQIKEGHHLIPSMSLFKRQWHPAKKMMHDWAQQLYIKLYRPGNMSMSIGSGTSSLDHYANIWSIVLNASHLKKIKNEPINKISNIRKNNSNTTSATIDMQWVRDREGWRQTHRQAQSQQDNDKAEENKTNTFHKLTLSVDAKFIFIIIIIFATNSERRFNEQKHVPNQSNSDSKPWVRHVTHGRYGRQGCNLQPSGNAWNKQASDPWPETTDSLQPSNAD